MPGRKLSFQRVNTNDPVLSKVQDNFQAVFNGYVNNPRLYSNTIKGVTFVMNKPVIIATGLDREYQGWSVVNKNNFGDIKVVIDNPNKSKQIILVSNGNLVADIEIW